MTAPLESHPASPPLTAWASTSNMTRHAFWIMSRRVTLVAASVDLAGVLLLVLLAFYLGLHTVSRALGAFAPLSPFGLAAVHAFNVVIVFGMAFYAARFYYGAIRRAERNLVQLAMHDPLTGLSNRRNLITQAEREMARARRTGKPIALVIANIDHFKQINDQRGHEVGDRVIAQAGNLMQQLCRSEDVVARWGGEEFLLLLPMTSVVAATELAERIRLAMEAAEVVHADQRIRFTFSLGVAMLNVDAPLDASIARADHAMYQSKTGGRNRVTVAA